MRLVTWIESGRRYSGVLWGGEVLPFVELDATLPPMLDDLLLDPNAQQALRELYSALEQGRLRKRGPVITQVQLTSPVQPRTLRDAYTFREHVERARRSRGQDVPPEYDQFPVYYYSNALNIYGPGSVPVAPSFWEALDLELEVAIVIGKPARNIAPEEALEYIFGLTIMNDFTARHIQRREMKMGMGPHHSKEFATALGPMLVTTDELRSAWRPVQAPHRGHVLHLHTRLWLNGRLLSENNLRTQTWTFGEVLARASEGITVQPGEVFGSGTVGLGCLMELNQEGLYRGWLQPGDEIILEVEHLGRLRNVVEKTVA